MDFKFNYDKVVKSLSYRNCVNDYWYEYLFNTESYISIKNEIYRYCEIDGIFLIKSKGGYHHNCDYSTAITNFGYDKEYSDRLTEKEYYDLMYLLEVEFKKHTICY
jgi:hypothetical protein